MAPASLLAFPGDHDDFSIRVMGGADCEPVVLELSPDTSDALRAENAMFILKARVQLQVRNAGTILARLVGVGNAHTRAQLTGIWFSNLTY
jgi:hypothetical protein